MSDLSFRVIIVPQEEVNGHDKDALLSKVKYTIENCGFVVTFINYSQWKKSEEEDYPEIEGLIFDVRAKSGTNDVTQQIKLYEDLCSKWKVQFDTLPCSYIELYSNDSFINSKCPHHKVKCQELAFGVLPHNGMFHQYTKLQDFSEKHTHFYHDTRNVVIEYQSYEMQFSYDNIRNIFVNIENQPSKVYFDLFNPPIIFRIWWDHNVRPRLDRNPRRRNPIPEIPRPRKRRQRNLNFRHCFRDPTELNSSFSIDTDVLGRANVLCFSFENPNEVPEILSRIHYQCSEKSVYFSCISPVSKIKPVDPVLINMHFDCTYLLTALFRRNFVMVSQTSDIHSSLTRLHHLSLQNADALERALTVVLAALDSGKILNFWHAIEEQYSFYTVNRDEIHFKDYIMPSRCCMIRRITVTPTRVLLWQSEIMLSNRVLRNFDSEYAVRVSFREDNIFKLSANASHADAGFLDACIKNPMTRGLRIGSRKYEFLAWSNSQIRDHGVWMYARDDQGRTAASIREWMGDFRHIHNVPKYMARMGQCFSQTEDALSVPLDPRHVRTEQDIEGSWDEANGKPYCFSDGIGRMSTELAAQVHKALGHDKLCSAFQIRYGGYKGMLVVDPELKDAQIVFRESMKKFDCPNSTRLEIAKTSAPSPLQLNRPFITILTDLGVRFRTFLKLQEEMLKVLTDMLYDEDMAAKFLRSKTSTHLYNFEDLSQYGIHLTTEPFFKSLLLALHRHHIEKIKTHANIAVDPSKGRNMLGVLDETGSLKYGEVFVQYTRDISYGETTRDTVILRGEVLVTKNPCMFPGDVRKFRAVDIPRLHHIVDCIVFPQKGPRPHTNEMAGSDLDGDEYSVLWEPELIFYRQNHEAADFPSLSSDDVSEITVQHMIMFLQDYIQNDQVGAIANAHQAHAHDPNNVDGIFSEVCLSIAKKFSIAVDFPKNGLTVRLEEMERPLFYPDFMEKSTCQTYRSEKALGKMYRVCKDFESENEVTSVSYGNITVDPDLVYDGWERYKNSAIISRNKYNALFRSVLRNYGIQHEAEALSGAFTKLHCRFHERRDRNEIEKVILGCIKKLNTCMSEEFQEEFMNSGEVKEIDERMLQKASAWYMVTYSDPKAKFLSFPWTVSKYLMNIKMRRTFASPLLFSPIIVNLDEKILECESKNLLPSYEETRIWNEYCIVCDSKIIKRALRTLMLWAQDEEVIERPGHTEGLLYLDVFVKLFLHASETLGYVTLRHNPKTAERDTFSAAHLCLEFLKFCSSFRFYNKFTIGEILPFNIYKHNKLAKRAIVSYHNFALTGTFQTLNFDKTNKEKLIEMKPFRIDSAIFGYSPITLETLKNAEETLVMYSKVSELNLREIFQTKKVCVTAKGSEQAIKNLKTILRKKHQTLRRLFHTGLMLET